MKEVEVVADNVDRLKDRLTYYGGLDANKFEVINFFNETYTAEMRGEVDDVSYTPEDCEDCDDRNYSIDRAKDKIEQAVKVIESELTNTGIYSKTVIEQSLKTIRSTIDEV